MCLVYLAGGCPKIRPASRSAKTVFAILAPMAELAPSHVRQRPEWVSDLLEVAKNFFPKPPAGSVSWRDKINEIGALLKQLWPQWQSRHTQQSIRLTGEPMDSADRGSQRQQSRQLGRLTDWLTRALSCRWLPSPISATKFVPPCDDSAHMDILRSAAAKRLIGIK
jgi:hypothetical protein